VAKSSAISTEKKVNFMRYTGEVILEKAFVIGVDKESYEGAKDMLSTTINVITQDTESLELLTMLNSHSDWVYAHSISSGMFALMIARVMGITSTQTFFKLGMAGLFHEIGYKEIPREILEKPRPLLSQSERALIETHVTRSREILMAIKGVPQDVTDIVYQHHEDMVGQGYPNRIDKRKIHPLAKIFQVADLFSDIAIKTPHHPGMSGPAALQSIQQLHEKRLDTDALRALHTIFNTSPNKPNEVN
jgi:putative nucleotidyltransferase with HDIG domain